MQLIWKLLYNAAQTRFVLNKWPTSCLIIICLSVINAEYRIYIGSRKEGVWGSGNPIVSTPSLFKFWTEVGKGKKKDV